MLSFLSPAEHKSGPSHIGPDIDSSRLSARDRFSSNDGRVRYALGAFYSGSSQCKLFCGVYPGLDTVRDLSRLTRKSSPQYSASHTVAGDRRSEWSWDWRSRPGPDGPGGWPPGVDITYSYRQSPLLIPKDLAETLPASSRKPQDVGRRGPSLEDSCGVSLWPADSIIIRSNEADASSGRFLAWLCRLGDRVAGADRRHSV